MVAGAVVTVWLRAKSRLGSLLTVLNVGISCFEATIVLTERRYMSCFEADKFLIHFYPGAQRAS